MGRCNVMLLKGKPAKPNKTIPSREHRRRQPGPPDSTGASAVLLKKGRGHTLPSATPWSKVNNGPITSSPPRSYKRVISQTRKPLSHPLELGVEVPSRAHLLVAVAVAAVAAAATVAVSCCCTRGRETGEILGERAASKRRATNATTTIRSVLQEKGKTPVRRAPATTVCPRGERVTIWGGRHLSATGLFRAHAVVDGEHHRINAPTPHARHVRYGTGKNLEEEGTRKTKKRL